MIVITLACVAAGYAALVGSLYVFQRNILFLPSSHVVSPAAAGAGDMRVVTLETSDGLALRSWYKPARDGRPTMIYFHGNGGNISGRVNRVRPYLNAGLGVLLVGYRGYGGNAGTPSEAGLYEDARAALRFIEAQDVPAERTVLYGESLGSAIAIHLAAEQAARNMPLAAVIGEGAPSSVVDVAARRYPFAPVRTLIRDRFDSRAKIADIDAPLLLIHGEEDRVVPPDFSRMLYEAAVEPKNAHWIETGGHNNLTAYGIDAIVLDFLERQLGSSGCAKPGIAPKEERSTLRSPSAIP